MNAVKFLSVFCFCFSCYIENASMYALSKCAITLRQFRSMANKCNKWIWQIRNMITNSRISSTKTELFTISPIECSSFFFLLCVFVYIVWRNHWIMFVTINHRHIIGFSIIVVVILLWQLDKRKYAQHTYIYLWRCIWLSQKYNFITYFIYMCGHRFLSCSVSIFFFFWTVHLSLELNNFIFLMVENHFIFFLLFRLESAVSNLGLFYGIERRIRIYFHFSFLFDGR